jgi:hypothetical protein
MTSLKYQKAKIKYKNYGTPTGRDSCFILWANGLAASAIGKYGHWRTFCVKIWSFAS